MSKQGETSPNRSRHRLFISYSHKDKKWLDYLATHLKPLEREGRLDVWADTRIDVGNRWRNDIEKALQAANVAVLLVSENFLESDFIHTRELPLILRAEGRRGLTVFWIAVTHCQWRHSPLNQFQPANDPEHPLESLSKAKRAQALTRIVDKIHDALDAEAPPSAAPIIQLPNRNDLFTGRDRVLQDLRERLTRAGTARGLAQRQAITGLGGMGKSQVALAYAWRYCDEYDAVFWVQASTEQEVRAGYAEIAALVDLPEQTDSDQSIINTAVKNWLITHDRWLLIFDSADRPEIVRSFLPIQHTGHVVITTRGSDLQCLDIVQPIELAELDIAEARDFLFKRVGRRQSEATEVLAACELARAVGSLPLALEQAGAYILAKRTRFEDYLKAFRTRALRLLEESRPTIGSHVDSVATTWSLNFGEVANSSTAAADLLIVSAFLAPDDVPLELIAGGACHLGPALSTAAASDDDNPLVLDALLAHLTRYSLVRRNIATRSYSMHSMTQAVIRDSVLCQAGEAGCREWVARVVRALGAVFPSVSFESWGTCERLMAHVMVADDLISTWGITDPEAAQLLVAAGEYLTMRAQYARAESLLAHALRMQDTAANDAPGTAAAATTLAELYLRLARLPEAASLFERAIEILISTVGAEHPDTASAVNGLGIVRYRQDRFPDAVALLEQALATRERLLGSGHEETIQTKINLAHALKARGRDTEADAMFGSLTAGPDQTLLDATRRFARNPVAGEGAANPQPQTRGEWVDSGPDPSEPPHPATAMRLTYLGSVFRTQNRHDDAEVVFRRALAISEQVLGPEHPDVASILENLAEIHHTQRRIEDAEARYMRAVEVYRKTLGPNNPDTAIAAGRLASLYAEQNRVDEAESLYRASLGALEQGLGPQHGETVSLLIGLARLYHDVGRADEAEQSYERLRAIRPKLFGADHSETAWFDGSLGLLRYHQQRYGEAAELFEAVLAARPDDLSAYCTLARTYSALGDNERAARVIERGFERHGGSKELHEELARIRVSEGDAHFGQGDFQKASLLYAAAIEHCPEDPSSHTRLAMALERLAEKPGDREQNLKKALDAQRRAADLAPEDVAARARLDEVQRRLNLVREFGDPVLSLLKPEPIRIELSESLLPLVDPQLDGSLFLRRYVPEMRARIQTDLGVALPRILFRGDSSMPPGAWSMLIDDALVATEQLAPDLYFATALQADDAAAGAREMLEPVSGRRGWLIEAARTASYPRDPDRLLDPPHLLCRQLEGLLRRNLTRFWGFTQSVSLLRTWAEDASMASMAASLLADQAAQLCFSRLLRTLLSEQIPIKDGEAILAAVAGITLRPASTEAAIRAVRLRLKSDLPGNAEGTLKYDLPFGLELSLEKCLDRRHPVRFRIKPAHLQEVLGDIHRVLPRPSSRTSLVVRNPSLRPFVRRMTESVFPFVHVLSREELTP